MDRETREIGLSTPEFSPTLESIQLIESTEYIVVISNPSSGAVGGTTRKMAASHNQRSFRCMEETSKGWACRTATLITPGMEVSIRQMDCHSLPSSPSGLVPGTSELPGSGKLSYQGRRTLKVPYWRPPLPRPLHDPWKVPDERNSLTGENSLLDMQTADPPTRQGDNSDPAKPSPTTAAGQSMPP